MVGIVSKAANGQSSGTDRAREIARTKQAGRMINSAVPIAATERQSGLTIHSICTALLIGRKAPSLGLTEILRDSRALQVEPSQTRLCTRIPYLRRLQIPPCSFGVILRNSPARGIGNAQKIHTLGRNGFLM